MKKAITPLTALPPTGMGAVDKAWDAVSVSFDRFCLTAGIEALGTMMEKTQRPSPGQDRLRWPPNSTPATSRFALCLKRTLKTNSAAVQHEPEN